MAFTFDPVGTVCVARQPGTEALQAWLIDIFELENLGTYGCRSIRNSTRLSFHGEGRAGDLGGPPANMAEAAAWLTEHAEPLGIQEVIHAGEIWRSNYSPPAWHPFTGSDPHYGHIHYALTWAAAQRAATATIELCEELPMRLTEADLAKIAELIDEGIKARIGDVAAGQRLNVSNAIHTALRRNLTIDAISKATGAEPPANG